MKRREPRPSQFGDFSFVIAAFTCFFAIASLVGAFLPAMVMGHWRSYPNNWRIFVTILTNGALAGVFLGAVYGFFSVLGCIAFGVGGNETSAERALDGLNTPIFIFGVAIGVVVGVLTATRFYEQWIWLWWRPSS